MLNQCCTLKYFFSTPCVITLDAGQRSGFFNMVLLLGKGNTALSTLYVYYPSTLLFRPYSHDIVRYLLPAVIVFKRLIK